MACGLLMLCMSIVMHIPSDTSVLCIHPYDSDHSHDIYFLVMQLCAKEASSSYLIEKREPIGQFLW